MSSLYYSQRQKRTGQPLDPNVGNEFCVAFRSCINRLASEDYLCQAFPLKCNDGYSVGIDDTAVNGRLREELGEDTWPISEWDTPSKERLLDLVEFFFRHVAKPVKYSDSCCYYCQEPHATEWDSARGRYEYTVQINGMFCRFGHPYKLQKGHVIRVGSEIMDVRVNTMELRTEDAHLQRLLNSAADNFYDRSGKKKLEGLRSLVDAYERLKTLEDTDKKKSVAKVIGNLSPDDKVRAYFDEHLRKMTEFSNDYTIRHHEEGKIVLDDDALIEYLFYSYYNLVRLILQKYGLVE